MSKYIDADQLKAEIERRRFSDQYTDVEACEQEIFGIIDSLLPEQPELPSNLDEAANDGWAVYEYRESPKGLYSTCYIDGFKAGAKWMVEQLNVIKE